MATEQNHNQKNGQEDEAKWEYLKQQISNMARFSEPPVNIKIIDIVTIILCGFAAAAIGWLCSLLFTEGRIGTIFYIWLIAGYILGGVVIFISFLSRMYNHMTRVKLSGIDYSHITNKGDKFISLIFRFFVAVIEVAACTMFTYAMVSISDLKIDKVKAAATMEELNRVTAYKDSLAEVQTEYYRGLDFDRDTTNDAWSRRMLEKVEVNRQAERIMEDSIRQVLTPVLADTSTRLASYNGTALLKDLTADKMPAKWRYKLSLSLLSLFIGIVILGGTSFCAMVKGRHKAYWNLKKVHDDVEQAPQGADEGSPGKFSKFSTWFSSVNGGEKTSAGGSGGDGFDWNSQLNQERLEYIKKNYRGYGGNKTMEEIGEDWGGIDKSYVSMFVKAAINKKLLLDFRAMNNGN